MKTISVCLRQVLRFGESREIKNELGRVGWATTIFGRVISSQCRTERFELFTGHSEIKLFYGRMRFLFMAACQPTYIPPRKSAVTRTLPPFSWGVRSGASKKQPVRRNAR